MRLIRIIFLTVLVVAATAMANQATSEQVANEVVTSVGAHSGTHSLHLHRHLLNIELPSMPDADLGSVSHTSCFQFVQRNFFSDFSDRYYFYPCGWQVGKDAFLAQEHKVYCDADILAESHPAGDYFVFTLRRILI